MPSTGRPAHGCGLLRLAAQSQGRSTGRDRLVEHTELLGDPIPIGGEGCRVELAEDEIGGDGQAGPGLDGRDIGVDPPERLRVRRLTCRGAVTIGGRPSERPGVGSVPPWCLIQDHGSIPIHAGGLASR